MKRLRLANLFILPLMLLPGLLFAQDWYEATGKPQQRGSVSSSDLRTEFASIETNIADKLPALTGNGSKVIAVNSGGTALEALAAGVPVASGGTGATTAAGARTNLGLVIGTDVQAWDADLDTLAASALAGLAKTDGNFIVANGTDWTVESGGAARTSLGLGGLATLSTINNGNWSGTDLSVANGGTGASTLTGLLQGNGTGAITGGATISDTNWSGTDLALANGGTGASTATDARSNLGLGSLATLSTVNDGNWSGTDLAVTNGGTGASTAGDARSNLGLGSLATASSISNSDWSGTDLAVANGGTGASDAATARTNLGAAATAHNHSAADITSGTLAVARGGTGQTTMDNVSEQVVLQWTIASDPGGTPTGSPGDVFAYY